MGAQERKRAAARKAQRLGVGVIVGAVIATVFAVTAQNGLPDYLPGVERMSVQASFEDSGALRVGDDVRIASVRAGFVESIEARDGASLVTLKLDHEVPVYHDARALISSRSSLGQKFVELEPGTKKAGELRDGQVLATGQTRSPIELDDLLDVFDERTRTAAGSTLRELGGGAGSRGQDLNDALAASPQLLDDLSKVSRALAHDDGADLTTLLETANSLSAAIKDQSGAISADVRQLSVTVDALATGGGDPLRRTIEKAPGSLRAVRSALASLDRPLEATRVAGERLRPGARALGQATPPLRGFLREAVPPLRKLPRVAPQATHALEALTPAMVAARRPADRAARALVSLAPVVASLAPYISDVVDFFIWGSDALAHGDSAGHWLRFTPITSPESLPVQNPFLARDAYPAPGEAKGRAR